MTQKITVQSGLTDDSKEIVDLRPRHSFWPTIFNRRVLNLYAVTKYRDRTNIKQCDHLFKTVFGVPPICNETRELTKRQRQKTKLLVSKTTTTLQVQKETNQSKGAEVLSKSSHSERRWKRSRLEIEKRTSWALALRTLLYFQNFQVKTKKINRQANKREFFSRHSWEILGYA